MIARVNREKTKHELIALYEKERRMSMMLR